MNSGPSGFGNAPVSKAIVLACGVSSILAQASRASRRSVSGRSPALQVLGHCFAFEGPAELLFGTFLLYHFRIIERQVGSARYGAFVSLVSTLAWALQLLGASRRAGGPLQALRASGGGESYGPGGPYGLIFASFVQFFYNVPPLSKFTVLGWRLNDKAFIYLAGLQLCLSGGTRTMLAGAAGLLAGLVYRSNVFGIRTWRVPRWLCRVAHATVGRLLDSTSSSSSSSPTSSQANGQAGYHGAPHQHRHGGPYPPGPAAAAARGGGGGGGPTWASAAAAGIPPNALQQQQQQRRAAAAVPQAAAPPPDAVAQLVAMGFDAAAAEQALRATHNDVQAAIGLLV